MQEGKRQKQVGGLLQQELSDIFQRLGLSIVDGSMVTISAVKLTPDLLEARVYLSSLQSEKADAVLSKINDRAWEIKKELSGRLGRQLRRMPEIKYFIDDTLDHVFKMEEIFKKIREEDKREE